MIQHARRVTIPSEGGPMEVNQLIAPLCWRCAHDGKQCVTIFEAAGTTETIWHLFGGTLEEVNEEIVDLGLLPPEPGSDGRVSDAAQEG